MRTSANAGGGCDELYPVFYSGIWRGSARLLNKETNVKVWVAWHKGETSFSSGLCMNNGKYDGVFQRGSRPPIDAPECQTHKNTWWRPMELIDTLCVYNGCFSGAGGGCINVRHVCGQHKTQEEYEAASPMPWFATVVYPPGGHDSARNSAVYRG